MEEDEDDGEHAVLRSVDDACLDCQCLHCFRLHFYANGRGDPEGIWTADHASHASSASRRAARLLSRKTGLPFPLPPHRAPAAAHSPPVLTPSARPFLSLSTGSSEAIPLSLSLHLSPILFFIPLSHQREGSDQIGCFFLVLVEV